MPWESMISIGVAIFFGTTTLILMVKYRCKRSLCYRVISETPLLRIEDEIKSDIKISYRNEKITDLHSLLVEISNNGNEPILKNDFKKPLTFEFNREAKISARLNHPHIVSIYDNGTDNGRFYIASEFVNGTVSLQGDVLAVTSADGKETERYRREKP